MNGFASFFVTVWDGSEEALELAIVSGACAGLLAIAAAAVNVFFRRRLSARQMGLLWGAVLLRLLMPVAPPSSLSLQNLLPSAENAVAAPSSQVITPYADSSEVMHDLSVGAAVAAHYSPTRNAPERAENDFDLAVIEDLICAILPGIWLVGAIATLLGATIVHWRFCRELKPLAPCGDPRLCDLWRDCRELADVRRNVMIILTNRIEQPAVLSLFRPKLLLPEDAPELDDRQLRMVMLHELAHVRRWHVAANWALLFIQAIHWWNPVYWLAAARFRNLREQACDVFAIRRSEGRSAHEYGELLLTLIARRPSRPAWRIVLPASIAGFFSHYFRKRAMHGRIKALQSAAVVRSRWHAAAVAALIAVMAACGLTDASVPEPAREQSPDWLPRAVHDWRNHWDSAPELDRGPSVTRTYDIEQALKKIVEVERSDDIARLQLKALLAHTLASAEGRFNDYVNDRWQFDERISLDDAALTLTASLKAHAEIAQALAAWEQSGQGQISVETRFISTDRDIAPTNDISWRYLEAFSDDRDEDLPAAGRGEMPVVRARAVVEDYLPIAVASLDERQTHALAQAAQSDKQANLTQAPKVTLFNGMRATVLDRTQTPFVLGIQQDERTGAQNAKIAVIDEGIKLSLRTVQSPDAAKVQLEARVELSEINQVSTVSTLLRGEQTTLQIPRVKRCRIDVASEVADGHSLLIGCIPTYEQKRFFYVLLTVRNLDLSAEKAN